MIWRQKPPPQVNGEVSKFCRGEEIFFLQNLEITGVCGLADSNNYRTKAATLAGGRFLHISNLSID